VLPLRKKKIRTEWRNLTVRSLTSVYKPSVEIL